MYTDETAIEISFDAGEYLRLPRDRGYPRALCGRSSNIQKYTPKLHLSGCIAHNFKGSLVVLNFGVVEGIEMCEYAKGREVRRQTVFGEVTLNHHDDGQAQYNKWAFDLVSNTAP